MNHKNCKFHFKMFTVCFAVHKTLKMNNFNIANFILKYLIRQKSQYYKI